MAVVAALKIVPLKRLYASSIGIQREGMVTSLQLATVQVPVGFTEVPALLG